MRAKKLSPSSLTGFSKNNLQLLRLLVQQELTLRYKRSVIGIGWTLLNPMLTSFVLWIVFSFLFAGKLQAGQQFAPYLMAGILLSTFFNQGLLQSANSIATNGGILTKVAVPPKIFAIAASLAAFANFLIGAGTGLALSVIFIRFDDARNIVNVLLLILIYLTPIFYPLAILSDQMRYIVGLNPLTSYLDVFRWSFSNNATATIGDFIYLSVTGVFFFILGNYIFKKYWPRTVSML